MHCEPRATVRSWDGCSVRGYDKGGDVVRNHITDGGHEGARGGDKAPSILATSAGRGQLVSGTLCLTPWWARGIKVGELPSRCAGPLPAGCCLHPGLCSRSPHPLSSVLAAAVGPHTPHWVPTLAARTWGCWGSRCGFDSLQLTDPGPMPLAAAACGTAPVLAKGTYIRRECAHFT